MIDYHLMIFMMIKKIISEIFYKNNLSFSWKDDNWDLLLNEINDSKIFFSSNYINYQIKYLKSFYKDVEDVSLIFYEDNKPIAFWYLISYNYKNKLNLTSDGSFVFTPKNIHTNKHTNFSKKMINVFLELLANKSLNNFSLKEDIRLYGNAISNMHSELLKNNFRIKSVYNIVLHLNKSITQIKSGFRKSYKSMINSGLKSFNVQYLDYYDKKLFGKFKSLHKKAAGKVTRSDDSWDFQLDMIKSKNAILSYVLKDDKMIGGALFFLNHGEALYAVGAYDRDLNHLPIGHIIHYKSIEYFLENKIVIYRIGEFLNSNLNPSITKKEESISFFKDGFGGNKHISNIFNLT